MKKNRNSDRFNRTGGAFGGSLPNKKKRVKIASETKVYPGSVEFPGTAGSKLAKKYGFPSVERRPDLEAKHIHPRHKRNSE